MTDPPHWLDQVFAQGKDAKPPTTPQLQALRNSEADQRRFDTLSLAERALHGAPTQRSPLERQVGLWCMEAALDKMLLDEDTHSKKIIPLPGRLPRPSWLIAAAAVCVCIIGAGLLWQRMEKGTDGFQPRSASSVQPSLTPSQNPPELLIYCGMETPTGFRFSGPQEAAFGTVRCPRSGEVKFAINNLPPTHTHLSLIGLSAKVPDQVLWYGPSPAAPSSTPLSHVADKAPVPTGESVRLEVNHQVGVVKVWGILSKSPVNFDTLKRRLDPTHLDAHTLSQVFDAVVVSAEFDVIPALQETP